MYVVMVAPECAPAAKAGGLGDVVSGLSRELETRGNTVEIILPKYANMRYPDIGGLAPGYHDLRVPWYDGIVACTVWDGRAGGRKCFFIEPHEAGFFTRDRMYGYPDDAGADILVVPSMFEPCGLAPLIGMRYGTVPVARGTGGMIDTVFDRDHSRHPRAERNGYIFHHTDNEAIESALSRALRLAAARPREFRHLSATCMRADYSWTGPGREYLDIYANITKGGHP